MNISLEHFVCFATSVLILQVGDGRKTPQSLPIPCPCVKIKSYLQLDAPVRRFVRMLHEKGICTNSSEGGGSQRHGAPDFAYVEAHLTKRNLGIVKKEGLLLDKLYNCQGKLLFFGSAIKYGRQTGFYLIGLERAGLSDRKVEKRLCSILPRLHPQRKHVPYPGCTPPRKTPANPEGLFEAAYRSRDCKTA